MSQKLYILTHFQRIGSICLIGLLAASCSIGSYHRHDYDHGSAGYNADHGHGDGSSINGLSSGEAFARITPAPEGGVAVGAVVSAKGRDALKPYQRWRYADQLASNIIDRHPRLEGRVDSYEYVARRMGTPFSKLMNDFRLNGDLGGESLRALRRAELRRKYLMMVSILPWEELNELPPPDHEPVVGRLNPEVDDYLNMRYQSIRLVAMRVQVYDTVAGQKIADNIFRSDDGGVTLATESGATEYVGNSVIATIANSLSNGLRNTNYPPPPKADDVYEYVWANIAQAVPDSVR